jgi:hypothetical protein
VAEPDFHEPTGRQRSDEVEPARAATHQLGVARLSPAPGILRRLVFRHRRSVRLEATGCLSSPGCEWSEDRLDLVMTWVVEVPVGGLAEIQGGVTVLVAKIRIGSVFE